MPALLRSLGAPNSVESGRLGGVLEDSKNTIRAFSRGLAVIRAFGPQHDRLSVTDVSIRTGIERATVRRLLLTLVEEGYAETDGKWYRLQPRVLDLGFSYLGGQSWWSVLTQALAALSRNVNESCSAGMLIEDEVVYIAREAVQNRITVDIRVGTRVPAYRSSMGRLLMSVWPDKRIEQYLKTVDIERRTAKTLIDPKAIRREIAEAAKKGYCYVEDEFEVGLSAVAVPVTVDGQYKLAINIALLGNLADRRQRRDKLLPDLKRCAEEVEIALRRGALDMSGGLSSPVTLVRP